MILNAYILKVQNATQHRTSLENTHTVKTHGHSGGLAAGAGLLPDHNQTPAPEPRLAHLHGGWRVFAQRLLRQSRVKSNLHHAGEETPAWVVCANKRRKTVGGGLQDPLLSAAPRCDALCNLGFI